jgi:hypothetical protein
LRFAGDKYPPEIAAAFVRAWLQNGVFVILFLPGSFGIFNRKWNWVSIPVYLAHHSERVRKFYDFGNFRWHVAKLIQTCPKKKDSLSNEPQTQQ